MQILKYNYNKNSIYIFKNIFNWSFEKFQKYNKKPNAKTRTLVGASTKNTNNMQWISLVEFNKTRMHK